MTDANPNPGAPRKILLATDMSARGDRALERAVAIATGQGAQLIIVHVVEEFDESSLTYGRPAAPSWRRPPDAVDLIRRRISQGLRADLGQTLENATVYIEEGNTADVIEQLATSENVDVVVTGVAKERLFSSRPVILGKTVEQLLRRLPIPVLIVRDRVRGEYQNIVVTTDFSKPSANALQVALSFFPHQTLHLLHASEAPYATLVPDASRHAESYTEVRAGELETFLDSIFVPDADRKRLVPVIEPGPPQQLVREYVQVSGADLVVLGTHGRGAMLEAIMGSVAKSILATLPCDALVVRGPPR